MSELGALLRKSREQKGFTLDDIQNLTKIQKRYLEAIEEGNYKVLPGNFYVRAFIKNYAEAVGLNTEDMLELFKKEVPSITIEPTPDPVMMPRRAASRTADRFNKWGFTLMMWLFFILIVVIFYIFVLRTPEDNANKTADQDTNITNESKPPADNKPGTPNNGATDTGNPTGQSGTGQTDQPTKPPQNNSDLKLTFVEKKGKTEYYTINTTGTAKYTFKVNNRAWSQINEGSQSGKVLRSGIDDSGAEYSFDVNGGIYFSLGRSDYVEITVNGQVLEFEPTKSTTRKIQIDVATNEATGQTGTQQ
ncbi:RodZ domain-containing protein [Paenibacillus sp. GCM10012307]|uniref:Helix-turn-helix domain-containing protein n=1 Tax=Paenibacillus roseus TaxID=2798579 RepID=A0A934MMK6_9BACL|nr:RodZ domain-containing protein [Paenibacillus roseus]MBJ6363445.1 helix-turn-helix domain-containing protein [Paenibacillus roseus]